ARWSELNRSLRGEVEGGPAPSRNDEYMLYQALLGAWPAPLLTGTSDAGGLVEFSGRMERFLVKALREAKLETSWDNPNQSYEETCLSFARALFSRTPNPFLADFGEFAGRVGFFAMLSGLSQTVLRLTAPGVPDTYQGSETWNLSLVDPDNRAPIDFARCRRLDPKDADQASSCAALPDMIAGWQDGRIKMHLTAALLRLRRAMPEGFLPGQYDSRSAEGARADHLVAFARKRDDRSVAVLAGRLFVGLLGWDAARYDGAAWRDTRLASPPHFSGRWHDVLTGAEFDLGETRGV